MKKEFVTYEQALALKELGFDEPCFGYWQGGANIEPTMMCNQGTIYVSDYNTFKNTFPNGESRGMTVISPLYQQAFRWFREKYNIQGYIYSSTVRGTTEKTKQFTGYIWNINGIDTPFLSTDARDELHDTYEEAESDCLDKLIEICKNK